MQACLCHATINFCHPKYTILYGALMIFVVGSVSSSPATTVTWLMLLVVSC